MNISQVTYPSGTIITLAEAKLHLRITADDQDAVINDCIKAATNLVESYTNQLFQSRTFVAYMDESEFCSYQTINILKYPITSIDSIKYLDTSGVEQTFSTGNYSTDLTDCPARILPTTTASVKANVLNQYRVYFTAGFASRDSIEPELINWIKIFTGFFFNTRQPEYTGLNVNQTAYKYQEALDKYRKDYVI